MHRFVLTSRWRLGATDAERVWQLLTDVAQWPRWWPYAREARIVARGAGDPLGNVVEIRWASALVYGIRLRMTTTRAERPRELEGRAAGDLRGLGTWVIEPLRGGAVDVTYRWDVVLDRPWMRALAFVLRPLFEWNHFVVMRAGARGMARALGCELSDLGEWSGAVRR